MAKSGITNISGGGAIGSDELSVTKKQVMKGKTYVGADTNDEIGIGELDLGVITTTAADVVAPKVIVDKAGNPVTGTMVERGAYTDAIVVWSDANNFAAQIPNGAYRTNSSSGHPEIVTPTVNVRAALGVESWKFRADTTIGGLAGGIPSQNAETGGDRAWATNMNNWAGTINLGVRNGYYLNGVNWIQVNIPEYQPWNIKKGVNMGGQVGTFEGYIANPTDLYYKGINPVGFYSTNENYVIFDAAQITLPDRNMNSDLYIKSSSNVSLVGYSYVNIHYVCTGTAYSYTPTLLFTINNDETLGHNYLSKGDSTLSINVVAYQKNGIVGIRMGKWSGYIDRIWLT